MAVVSFYVRHEFEELLDRARGIQAVESGREASLSRTIDAAIREYLENRQPPTASAVAITMSRSAGRLLAQHEPSKQEMEIATLYMCDLIEDVSGDDHLDIKNLIRESMRIDIQEHPHDGDVMGQIAGFTADDVFPAPDDLIAFTMSG